MWRHKKWHGFFFITLFYCKTYQVGIDISSQAILYIVPIAMMFGQGIE